MGVSTGLTPAPCHHTTVPRTCPLVVPVAPWCLVPALPLPPPLTLPLSPLPCLPPPFQLPLVMAPALHQLMAHSTWWLQPPTIQSAVAATAAVLALRLGQTWSRNQGCSCWHWSEVGWSHHLVCAQKTRIATESKQQCGEEKAGRRSDRELEWEQRLRKAGEGAVAVALTLSPGWG